MSEPTDGDVSPEDIPPGGTESGTQPDASPVEAAPDSGRSVMPWLIALALVAAGVAAVIAFVATGLRMRAHATVGGVDVSGLTPETAEAKVDAALRPHANDLIVLTHAGRDFPIYPAGAGLTVDVEQSVRQAGGFHSLNPVRFARLFFGRTSVPLVVSADEDRLASAIRPISAVVDTPAVEPLVTFNGTTPKVRAPQPGVVIDQEGTIDAIREAYLREDRVPLRVRKSQPVVGQRGLNAAMRQIVEPALSGPVTVKIGDQSAELPVSAYAPALSVRVVGVALRPHLDVNLLAKPLTDATTGIAETAVDATVTIKNGKPVVVPDKPGVGLQPHEMAQKLIPAILAKGAARSVTVESKIARANFTTEDAKALNIKEKISEFVTYFHYARYRNHNQSRAAELVNGTILKPGDTFSLNDTLGERSAENGFVKGIVIGDTGVFTENFGGGVSQVATTVYNAAFFAGLEDLEHHPHTFYIPRYPVGREATVWYGVLDLRFRNTLANGILIRAWVVKGTPTKRGEMHVQMWGTKEWDIDSKISKKFNEREPGIRYDPSEECIAQQPSEGFEVDVTRTFRRPGSTDVVKTDQSRASYVPGDEVICEEPPAPATPAPVAPQPWA
jgi:vancomycin resistance protein YoaR